MTAGRAFVKMHGLRNHFVIVDARKESYTPSRDEIVRICDVQTGVGADQLIIIEPANDAAAFMRILNTDGREAEACGNATRCVAWLLLEETGTDALFLETRAGRLRCERAGALAVRCSMGEVSRDWRKIPLSREHDTLAADIASGPLQQPLLCSVGNPHAVFFVDDTDAVDLESLAPAVQQHPLLPQQANVGAAQLIDATHLKLRVYERGAGLTMACGSGACAAVFAARERGLTTAAAVTVSLPGGDVAIEITDGNEAIMTGPVAFSFYGTLPA